MKTDNERIEALETEVRAVREILFELVMAIEESGSDNHNHHCARAYTKINALSYEAIEKGEGLCE